MEKLKRNNRLVLICKELIESPHKLFTIGYFANKYNASRASISEDLALIKDILQNDGEGNIITTLGVGGGVVFIPSMNKESEIAFLNNLAQKLQDKKRLLPAGYVYMLDLICNPSILKKLGTIFATRFKEHKPDYIVTVETKGIPLALSTAQAFDVPLVIVRNDNRVTEGASISINYVSGSTHKIGTMTLAKRALTEGKSVIVIDDFMKAGGTAQGMVMLMEEFKVKVLGIGVLISTEYPKDKLVSDYLSLLTLCEGENNQKVIKLTQS